MSEFIDRQTINGKPYFGKWISRLCIIYDPVVFDKNNPVFADRLAKLRDLGDNSLEVRQEQIIFRPAIEQEDITIESTLAIKCIVWGRAYKVMRFIQSFNKKNG